MDIFEKEETMDKKEVNEVDIPERCRANLAALAQAARNAQAQINTYAQGLMDTMDLKGQWELNMDTWKFIKRGDNGQTKEP